MKRERRERERENVMCIKKEKKALSFWFEIFFLFFCCNDIMRSETLYNLIKFASFCVTVLLSFGLAAFCCAKLCTKLGEGEKSMYMSMLTSVVSLWIPSPTSMMTLRMGGGANEPPVQDKRVRSMKLITLYLKLPQPHNAVIALPNRVQSYQGKSSPTGVFAPSKSTSLTAK